MPCSKEVSATSVIQKIDRAGRGILQPSTGHVLIGKSSRIVIFSMMTLLAVAVFSAAAWAEGMAFPGGAATPSEVCGKCHKAIYRECAFGVGSESYNTAIFLSGSPAETEAMPANVSDTATGSAFAGLEPFPLYAREAEEGEKLCAARHIPEPFNIPGINVPMMVKPKVRPKGKEVGGITCVSCHLTPDGKIRGPYKVKGPHDTVAEPAITTRQRAPTVTA
jgi:hypothetical protein